MTSYRLKDDLTFCRIDGRPIFLDTREDRYFRLSNDLERAFNAHIDGIELPPADIKRLMERNILTDVKPIPNSAHDPVPIASRSALELPSPPAPPARGLGTVAETLAIVCRTQYYLKARSLKAVLDDTISRRPRKPILDAGDTESRLLNEVRAFLKARKLVPMDTRCLLDSLSMVIFLARRRLYANIVFGVTGDPFTAHCWAQAGDLVLNDALGNIRAYTAIRVI